jgi:broad specificity phosphatase PhoE
MICLARHGHASWTTAEGKAVDDPGLTALGIEQSRYLAQRVEQVGFDEVLASPLKRVQETVERFEGASSPKVRAVEWLAEIRYPSWQGQPAEVASRALAEVRALPPEGRWNAYAPHGEDTRAFFGRVSRGFRSYLESIGTRETGDETHPLWELPETQRRLLLVSHAGNLPVILGVLLGIPIVPWERERFQFAHGSLTTLVSFDVGGDSGFSLTRLSDVSHLPHDLVSW